MRVCVCATNVTYRQREREKEHWGPSEASQLMFIHDNHDHSDDGGDNDVDDAHVNKTETRMSVILSLYYIVDDRN